MTDKLHVETGAGGIAVLTLNNGPVNVLHPAFLAQLDEAMQACAKDPEVRAVVLTSAFRVFSAGLDLKEAAGYSQAQQTALVDALTSAFMALYAYPKPLIIAANGAAIAGGMFLVLVADFTVAAEQAKFGLSEVRVGARFPAALLEIARDALSPPAFRKLLLSGLPVNAADAKVLGIIDEVAQVDAVLSRAIALAGDLAALPPQTYAAIKAQMRAPALERISHILKANTDPVRNAWFTDETRAAMQAVLNAGGKKAG